VLHGRECNAKLRNVGNKDRILARDEPECRCKCSEYPVWGRRSE